MVEVEENGGWCVKTTVERLCGLTTRVMVKGDDGRAVVTEVFDCLTVSGRRDGERRRL